MLGFYQLALYILPTTFGLLLGFLLLYAIFRDKTKILLKYKPFVLKITTGNVLNSFFYGFGGLLEPVHPLPVFKVKGFYSFFGSYGGSIAFFMYCFISLAGIVAMLECAGLAFVNSYGTPFEFGNCLIVSVDLLTLFGGGAAIALLTFYLVSDEELVDFGKSHNFTTILQAIDNEEAILVMRINGVTLYIVSAALAICTFLFIVLIAGLSFYAVKSGYLRAFNYPSKNFQKHFSIALLAQSIIICFPVLAQICILFGYGIESFELVQIWYTLLGFFPTWYALLHGVICFAFVRPYRTALEQLLGARRHRRIVSDTGTV